MYANEKDATVCFFVTNVCFVTKVCFFRVAEVCFCLFFKEKMVWIWSVFFKIRSVLIIGDIAIAEVIVNLLHFVSLVNACSVKNYFV